MPNQNHTPLTPSSYFQRPLSTKHSGTDDRDLLSFCSTAQVCLRLSIGVSHGPPAIFDSFLTKREPSYLSPTHHMPFSGKPELCWRPRMHLEVSNLSPSPTSGVNYRGQPYSSLHIHSLHLTVCEW